MFRLEVLLAWYYRNLILEQTSLLPDFINKNPKPETLLQLIPLLDMACPSRFPRLTTAVWLAGPLFCFETAGFEVQTYDFSGLVPWMFRATAKSARNPLEEESSHVWPQGMFAHVCMPCTISQPNSEGQNR